MNKDRRKELEVLKDRLGIVVFNLNISKDELEEIKGELEGVQADEQEYLDNMPESFQQGEKGQAAESAIDEMMEATTAIEEAIDHINNAQG